MVVNVIVRDDTSFIACTWFLYDATSFQDIFQDASCMYNWKFHANGEEWQEGSCQKCKCKVRLYCCKYAMATKALEKICVERYTTPCYVVQAWDGKRSTRKHMVNLKIRVFTWWPGLQVTMSTEKSWQTKLITIMQGKTDHRLFCG